jgi:hypothetical protein
MDWDAAATRLNADPLANSVRWDRDRTKSRLNHYGERRDKIAHEGDLKPAKHTANPIRKQDVVEAVRIIRHVGETVMDTAKACCK